ncbi:recombinase family protein [Anaerofustis stercorihominis]|uniref:recombinase family protein n=1 Tax=Anaerofustis stercorihominis TaxID=214853 RepID=UPI0021096107|nr:recombinase family protein [Anaerofustis stercorihominis]MCQ4794180.1 recombinase family protein [Anaerofustis stercorihominis]
MKTKCYIYTRVSTSMQVDGYSLDAQKNKLRKYADFSDMIIANEYSDEGKSGKSVQGREEFQQMLADIQEEKDGVSFVLVFKLSRFGRNAADVLNSLQLMQDFGVNLICVEDGIDSSKDSGKLMISVLSAVAEIERDNIIAQTMAGRKEKAREGKWNGGFAPYGYKLINGELFIEEEEAEVIRIIFNKFVNTTIGANGIAKWLNDQGIKKHVRQNGTLSMFSASFIKSVLDNPVYYGKIAFGRRKKEKVTGKRNEYKIVKQKDFMLYDGIHEAIISEEVWKEAHKKRIATGVKREKIYSIGHEHILSGIIKCPVCGAGMYGNVNRKKRPDGTLYKDYFFYMCKHRRLVDGHKCTFGKQWSEDVINDAVAEIVKGLVKNPKFTEAIQSKINKKVDGEEVNEELKNYRKQLAKVNGNKRAIEKKIDELDVMDKHYDRKVNDLQNRLDRMYDIIDDIEENISECLIRKESIEKQKVNEESVYKYLLLFDELYDKFTDMEKKTFYNSFVEEIQIYEEAQSSGQILKSIKFKFPVFYDGRETSFISWDRIKSTETVVLLTK